MTVEYRGPPGLKRLVEALHIDCFHRAVNISLHGPKYTDAVIEELGKLKSLETVTLYNTKITDDGVNQLKRALPDCRIERSDALP